MEKMLVSDKNYRLQVFFLLQFFVSFLILSQPAWAQTTLNLQATWTAPTTNTDGSKLTDLASFNFYRTDTGTPTPVNTTPIPTTMGTAASPYPFQVSVSGAVKMSFYVTAVDSVGNESAPSATAYYDYVPPPPSVSCTVATSPSLGPQIMVDGKSYPSGSTFSWIVGSKHMLAVTSPQNGTPGIRYVFTKWSNGSTSKTQTITAPAIATTYTAYFTTVNEQVTTPTTPRNITNGFTGTTYTFSSHSTSSFGYPVQYQYTWGDGTTSDYGRATQSHFWVNAGTYTVTVTARSATDTNVVSSPSASAAVNIQEKPFIHVTSPNGGETWVAGTTPNITWEFNYLNHSGTIYLYYWYLGGWYSIGSVPASSIAPTSSSYQWTVPSLPSTPSPPGATVPKSHMAWTSVYIGNWVPNGSSGTWQCWDTSDKNFRILDQNWAFTISGPDKGGATLFFNTDETTFDGYGMLLKLGMFEITGSYTVSANGLVSGSYSLTDLSGTPLGSPNGTGTITGTLGPNAAGMTLTLKNTSNVALFTMSGVWDPWLSGLNMPETWSVQISASIKGVVGKVKGTINPLTIGAVEESNNNNESCANLFTISGSGTLGTMTISIDAGIVFTPYKTPTGNVVYGIYDNLIVNGNPETGTLSGTLNPATEKFTFNLTSTNGNKYTFAGAPTP